MSNVGTGGGETILGNAADNTIFGSEAGDLLIGLNGHDELVGNGGNDTLDGGNGYDTLIAGPGSDFLTGGNESDLIDISAPGGADTAFGGNDDDFFVAGTGAASVDGGAGFDIIDFGTAPGSVVLDLTAGSVAMVDGSETVYGVIRNVEAAIGGAFDDTLIGPAGATNIFLEGGAGNDLLVAAAGSAGLSGDDGNDTLQGTPGRDFLDGGAGGDLAILDSAAAGLVMLVDAAGFGGGAVVIPGFTTLDAEGDDVDTLYDVEVISYGGAAQAFVVPTQLLTSNGFALEGEAGTGTMGFVVYLSGSAITPGSFRVQTIDQSAQAGSDYVALDTVITVPFGAEWVSFGVEILGDAIAEGTETFGLLFSEATDVLFAGDTPPLLTGTIVDDDGDALPGGDVPDSIASTVPIEVGDVVTQCLEANGDHDFFRASLEGGRTYLVALQGQGSGSGTLGDPFLRIRDEAGTLITSNDDGGYGLDSFLSFTPEATGTYFIDVGAFIDSSAGFYTLRLYEPGTLPEIVADGLTVVETEGGTRVRIELRTSFPVLGDVTADVGLVGLSATPGEDYVDRVVSVTIPGANQHSTLFEIDILADDIEEALETIGIQVSNVVNAAASADPIAQIAIVDSDGRALFVDETEVEEADGVAIPVFARLAPGEASSTPIVFRYTVISGTAAHGEDFEGDLEGVLVIPPSAEEVQIPLTLLDDGVYEGTEMLLIQIDPADIAGAALGGSSVVRVFITDDDALQLDVDGVVVGEAGPDLLIGSAQADLLAGLGGDDVLLGEDAGDQLVGGAGADFILGDFILSGPQGPGGNDALVGGEGSDSILAGPGEDTLIGGDGDDVLVAEDGDDLVQGDKDNDALYGGNGADTVQGGIGNDFLFGEAGADVLDGGLGDDRIYVDQQDTFADGDDGTFDAVTPLGPGSWVIDLGAAGNQNLGAGPALYGFEVVDAAVAGGPVTVTGAVLNGAGNVLYGSAFADSITGSAATDIILGGEGGDHLDGGAGDDSIGAEADDDTVTGGAGADTSFYFASSGAVLITDFTPDEDVLGLASTLAGTAEAALGLAAQVGPDTVFDFGGGQTITLAGVTKSALDAGDLTFF